VQHRALRWAVTPPAPGPGSWSTQRQHRGRQAAPGGRRGGMTTPGPSACAGPHARLTCPARRMPSRGWVVATHSSAAPCGAADCAGWTPAGRCRFFRGLQVPAASISGAQGRHIRTHYVCSSRRKRRVSACRARAPRQNRPHHVGGRKRQSDGWCAHWAGWWAGPCLQRGVHHWLAAQRLRWQHYGRQEALERVVRPHQLRQAGQHGRGGRRARPAGRGLHRIAKSRPGLPWRPCRPRGASGPTWPTSRSIT
jgi:hypothetical protein